jgi:exonuclease VII small subunit
MVTTDEKITNIEKLVAGLEVEKNFDKALQQFTIAAKLIREALVESVSQKGKVLEIIRELDQIIEKELRDEDSED